MVIIFFFAEPIYYINLIMNKNMSEWSNKWSWEKTNYMYFSLHIGPYIWHFLKKMLFDTWISNHLWFWSLIIPDFFLFLHLFKVAHKFTACTKIYPKNLLHRFIRFKKLFSLKFVCMVIFLLYLIGNNVEQY